MRLLLILWKLSWPDALAERIRRGEEGLALALSLPEHDEPDSMRAPVSDVAPRFASLARRPTSGEGLSRAAWAQQEARLLLHVCYEEAGDTDSANALAADIALAVDRQALFRHSQLPYCCEVMRACSALMEGRWEAARGHAERAYRIGSACGEAGAEGVFSAQMFHLHRELAELQRFEPVLERFEAEHRDSVWSPGLALVYAELGRTEPARRELRRAISEAIHQRWSERLVPALALLADTCAQVGDKPEAQLIYSALLPYSGQMAVHATALSYGPVDLYLGALAHVDGDSERARSHFDAALTLCQHARSGPWLAHTQYAYARLLSDPSGRSDSRARERSIDLLQSATRIAQDLGMHRLLRKITGAGTGLDF